MLPDPNIYPLASLSMQLRIASTRDECLAAAHTLKTHLEQFPDAVKAEARKLVKDRVRAIEVTP